jgi:hypothetical protein
MTVRLVDRVAAAFADRDRRRRPTARLDERAARADLYPPAATINVAPRQAPLTAHARPTALDGGRGARVQQETTTNDRRNHTAR